MFYRPEDGHTLPHDPFKAIVSPRPIGWISTRDAQGNNNLAPYSFFNAIADNPPQVMFASTGVKPDRDGTKDSVSNIIETGEFCVNIAEYSAREAMNDTSKAWAREDDEFAKEAIEAGECETINCQRVLNAPASLECKLTRVIELPGPSNRLVLGQVTGIHLRDNCLVDGRFDVTTYQPLSRLGYMDFAKVSELFVMKRPGD
ncbi:MAG: flavin reductase [Rhodobacteraceae bacterium]|nr:MAG: flavin reductase [Paracoccaceae bacterium]